MMAVKDGSRRTITEKVCDSGFDTVCVFHAIPDTDFRRSRTAF